MDQQQLEKYLDRIGYTGGRDLTRETLDGLIRAHISTVPFENITVFDFGEVPSIDPDDLYEKIVERRRGGYCFELNTLFLHLLTAMGFEAFPVVARVAKIPGPTRPYAHKGVIASAEGKQWYCDVGFGGPSPKGALEIREGEQTVAGHVHRILFRERDLMIQHLEGGEWGNVLCFPLRPIEACDFIPLNYYIGSNPASTFRLRRTVNLTLPDGSKALTGEHFTLRRGGTVAERDCADKAELEQLLRDEFGIDVTLPG